MKKEDVGRFWAKVVKSDGCWTWAAGNNGVGYGKFYVTPESGKRKSLYAHRVAYELVKGAIPEGLHIDHLCRNRGCVNPHHMEAVTQGENTRRGTAWVHWAERRRTVTHCPQGHEYTPENTGLYRGSRQCKTCNRDRAKARYHRKKG